MYEQRTIRRDSPQARGEIAFYARRFQRPGFLLSSTTCLAVIGEGCPVTRAVVVFLVEGGCSGLGKSCGSRESFTMRLTKDWEVCHRDRHSYSRYTALDIQGEIYQFDRRWKHSEVWLNCSSFTDAFQTPKKAARKMQIQHTANMIVLFSRQACLSSTGLSCVAGGLSH